MYAGNVCLHLAGPYYQLCFGSKHRHLAEVTPQAVGLSHYAARYCIDSRRFCVSVPQARPNRLLAVVEL